MVGVMELYGTLRSGEKFRNFMKLYNGSDHSHETGQLRDNANDEARFMWSEWVWFKYIKPLSAVGKFVLRTHLPTSVVV